MQRKHLRDDDQAALGNLPGPLTHAGRAIRRAPQPHGSAVRRPGIPSPLLRACRPKQSKGKRKCTQISRDAHRFRPNRHWLTSNPVTARARHLRASRLICVYLRFTFLLPEQARNCRRGIIVILGRGVPNRVQSSRPRNSRTQPVIASPACLVAAKRPRWVESQRIRIAQTPGGRRKCRKRRW
jgi:hypothetical protein